MGKKEKDHKERQYLLKAFSLFSQLGLTMAICVIMGVLVGKFLDNLLGTSPWLLLVFVILGAMAAFKVMYDIVIKEWRE